MSPKHSTGKPAKQDIPSKQVSKPFEPMKEFRCPHSGNDIWTGSMASNRSTF